MKKKFEKLSPLTEASFYILLVLKKPLHGYGIIKEVETLSNNRLILAAGTLYGVLQNFQKQKLISPITSESVSKRKKEYVITDMGEELLKYEIKRLKELIKSSKKVYSND